MNTVQSRFLELANHVLKNIEESTCFANWAEMEQASQDLEASRRAIKLPEEVEKSPAVLIVAVKQNETPPLCDENLCDMLQRFTQADITWRAMISSDPRSESGSYLVTPLWRNQDDEIIDLSPFEKARTKAVKALGGWIRLIERIAIRG